jgi:hypothetical protein
LSSTDLAPVHRCLTEAAVLKRILFGSLFLFPMTVASGQSTAPNTYYANDGTNHTREANNGELERDVLGNIPLLLQGVDTGLAPNPYAFNWTFSPTFPKFLDALRKHAANLTALDAVVDLQCTTLLGASLVPFGAGQVVPEPTYSPNPKALHTWWGGSGGVPFMQWAYRINGGLVVISKRIDLNPTTTHILLTNVPWHGSDFGTNLPARRGRHLQLPLDAFPDREQPHQVCAARAQEPRPRRDFRSVSRQRGVPRRVAERLGRPPECLGFRAHHQ